MAVYLRDIAGLWHESGRLAEIETAILFDTGAVINALPLPRHGLPRADALDHELRRDGIDL